MSHLTEPALSIIVPACNAEAYLPQCLAALLAERDAGSEIVVVDDGSTDGSAQIVDGFGVRRLPVYPNIGPGPARNLGVQETRAEILLFVDADVVVAPGTLARLRRYFSLHRDAVAVFGSYDTAPAAPGLISQYRNLLHHFVHQEAGPEASHFWAGLGAVRRAAFLAAGGFDAGKYARTVEDVELGYRLRAQGGVIGVDRDLLGKHLKRWTLWSMIRTDFAVRGLPWTRLLLERRHVPQDLSLGWAARGSAALAGLSVAALAAGSIVTPVCLAFAAACTLLFLVLNRPLFGFLRCARGIAFAAACVPLHLLYHLVVAAAGAAGLAAHVLDWQPQATSHGRRNCDEEA